MATNNTDEKRTTRAARRAAQEAAAKAAAEKAAKERRQQTIIGGIVVGIIVVLIAGIIFAVWNAKREEAAKTVSSDEAYSALQTVDPKPSLVDDKGGIVVSKDGYNKPVEGVPTAAIYMDFICPGCGTLNQKLDPTLIKLVEAGQLNLELHILSFMDQYSTDEYSSRAANAALYVAEHDDDPDHLLQFISNLYDDGFQPKEGPDYVSVSDEQIREQAVKAGVSKDVADKASTRQWDSWLQAVSQYTPSRSELWNESGRLKGQFSTPTVTINGRRWNIDGLAAAGYDLPSGFLASIGLEENQVGTDSLPSIKEGKPIALS